MENYAIAIILQLAREALGYSRNEVCRLCENQFSEKTLYRLEMGYAKASNDTVEKIGEIYNKSFSKLKTTIDMNKYSMLRMYGEIINSIFQLKLAEAEYKLSIFEKYVEKDSNNVGVIEFLRLAIDHYKLQDYSKEGKHIVSKAEEILNTSIHQSADISRYPLTDMEINLYFIYIDALRKFGQYEDAIELATKLLKNITQEYHNESIFCDYYGALNAELAVIYRKTNRHWEAMELVKQAVQIVGNMGDLSNTYKLYNIFVQSAEDMEFFLNENIKKECIEMLRRMHSICLACNMTQKAVNIKERLVRDYNMP